MPEEHTSESAKEQVQLTVNDLVAMKNIIEIASQRGTFKPTEMTTVGQTYTKISTFLDTLKQPQGE